jgi:hypothetical protein
MAGNGIMESTDMSKTQIQMKLKNYQEPGEVAHAFNPSTREAEADGFLSLRPAWSTEWVPGQPGLHRETLSWKPKKKKKKKRINKSSREIRVTRYMCFILSSTKATDVPRLALWWLGREHRISTSPAICPSTQDIANVPWHSLPWIQFKISCAFIRAQLAAT